MKSLAEVKNLKGRTALVRVDWNVPVGKDGNIGPDEAFRIRASLETISYLRENGAKTILVSHIGRAQDSMRSVADYAATLVPLTFVPTIEITDVAGIVAGMSGGDVILLENLRRNPGEESNDIKFARSLASLADLYVNEAFSVSHRQHASIVGLPLYLQSYAGMRFVKECTELNKVLQKPEHPFVMIIGGAKFETKMPLINKFAPQVDELLIAGALANNFFKAVGMPVGKSLLDPNTDVKPLFNKHNIKVPFDVMTENGPRDLSSVGADESIVDMGEGTLAEWKHIVSSAKTVVWNGPLGVYENGFDASSIELLKAIADSGAFSVIGGGDTTALVHKTGLIDKLSFVSTGGGAMLEFLEKGTLPGVLALESNDDLSRN